jgi:hypothetical protein
MITYLKSGRILIKYKTIFPLLLENTCEFHTSPRALVLTCWSAINVPSKMLHGSKRYRFYHYLKLSDILRNHEYKIFFLEKWKANFFFYCNCYFIVHIRYLHFDKWYNGIDRVLARNFQTPVFSVLPVGCKCCRWL